MKSSVDLLPYYTGIPDVGQAFPAEPASRQKIYSFFVAHTALAKCETLTILFDSHKISRMVFAIQPPASVSNREG